MSCCDWLLVEELTVWNEFKRATIEGIKQGIRWSLAGLFFIACLGLGSLIWWLGHVRFNF